MIKLFFLLALVLSFNSIDAQALERSAISGQSSAYTDLKQNIEDLEALKNMIATSISIIKSCGDTNQVFDGTAGCKPVMTENDPDVLDHSRTGTSGDISVSCNAQNQAQYYNGTSWVCKTMAP